MNDIEELFLCKHQRMKIYTITSYFVSLAYAGLLWSSLMLPMLRT